MVNQTKITRRFLENKSIDTGTQWENNIVNNVIGNDGYCNQCGRPLVASDVGLRDGLCRRCIAREY